MLLVKNNKVMYGLLTRSSDRPTDRPSDRPTKWGTLSLTANPLRPCGGCPIVGMKVISKPVDGLHSTAIYLLKMIICPFKRVRAIMFLVKNDKVMYGLLTRSTDRSTYPMRNALAQCEFPRPGGGYMVGLKVISKSVDCLHSTAIYLLKENNLPIQTSKRYHVFGEK